jgi:cation-transporting ATPase E
LALREANCSIAISSGSPATCKIASLVLKGTKTNEQSKDGEHGPGFASLNSIVNEGRRVINNIQKVSMLFLVKTIFSILLTIMYLIFSMVTGPLKSSYPFTTTDLTLIETLIIGIPGFCLTIQVNTNKVKGRFVGNVIRNALPGIFTVVIIHFSLIVLKAHPDLSFLMIEDTFRTMLMILTTEVMFIVLFNACRKFNTWKTFMFGSALLFAIWIVIRAFNTGSFLGVINLEKLTITSTLLLIVFGLIATILMSTIQYIVEKISKKPLETENIKSNY